MHRCPNPRLPVARARDADQLGDGRGRHRGRRRAVRPPALGARPRPLDPRPVPADEGAAARARRLPGEVGDATRSTRSRRRRRAVPPRALRPQHPGGRLGDGAEPRAPLRHRRRARRRHARRRSRRSRASARTAPRRSPSGSRTRRTALVEELRELGIRLEAGEERPPGRGAADRQHVRDHRHARALHARAGRRGAGGAGREGRRLGLEEDERRDRRRGAGRDEAEQGARQRACRSSTSRRSRSCSTRTRRRAPASR